MGSNPTPGAKVYTISGENLIFNNTSMKSKFVWWIVGVAVVVIGAAAYFGVRHTPPASSGPSGAEGSVLDVSVPAGTSVKGPVTATFYDAGPHGWHPVSGGAAIYMAYDSTTGLSYNAPVEQIGEGASYVVTVPTDMCGYIIQSNLEAPAGPKVLKVTLKDADGKIIEGASPSTYNLTCDKYTLKVTIKSSKDPVLPDGADQSVVTATWISASGKSRRSSAKGAVSKTVSPRDLNLMARIFLGVTTECFLRTWTKTCRCG